MSNRTLFYLVGGLATLGLLVLIVGPFLKALAWAAILATAFHPVHARIRRRLPNRPTAAATLSALLIVLLIIGPSVALIIQMGQEAITMLRDVEPIVRGWLSEGPAAILQRLEGVPLLGGLIQRVESSAAWQNLDLKGSLLNTLRRSVSGIGTFAGGLARNLAAGLLSFFILILALVAALRDGGRWADASRHWLPMKEEDRLMINQDLRDATYAVLYGLFLTALIQGALAGFAYVIIGAPSPVLLAVATAMGALLLPFMGGTTLVWGPLMLTLFFQGRYWAGLFMLAWGIFPVSIIDNFLKPIFIGSKARLPMLWVYLGILGGVGAFGLIGLFAGPLILVFARAFLSLARRELLGEPAAAHPS